MCKIIIRKAKTQIVRIEKPQILFNNKLNNRIVQNKVRCNRNQNSKSIKIT